jgi:hypothetical protein
MPLVVSSLLVKRSRLSVPQSSTNDVLRVQFGRQAERLTRPVAEQVNVGAFGIDRVQRPPEPEFSDDPLPSWLAGD